MPKGGKILDLFAGTASSALAVIQMNALGYDFSWEGCEMDLGLFQAAFRRLLLQKKQFMEEPGNFFFYLFLVWFSGVNLGPKNLDLLVVGGSEIPRWAFKVRPPQNFVSKVQVRNQKLVVTQNVEKGQFFLFFFLFFLFEIRNNKFFSTPKKSQKFIGIGSGLFFLWGTLTEITSINSGADVTFRSFDLKKMELIFIFYFLDSLDSAQANSKRIFGYLFGIGFGQRGASHLFEGIN